MMVEEYPGAITAVVGSKLLPSRLLPHRLKATAAAPSSVNVIKQHAAGKDTAAHKDELNEELRLVLANKIRIIYRPAQGEVICCAKMPT